MKCNGIAKLGNISGNSSSILAVIGQRIEVRLPITRAMFSGKIKR
jgi:hypothetical protein